MPDLTWAYGVTVPLAVIMLCVTFWASRKESKEKNASVLEKIKSDLVTMHTCEREAATKRRDLAQKRIDLKMRKKKKAVVRENTYRVSALTYGLNSSILLRGILQAVPEGAISEEQRVKLVEIRIALEDIEPKGEKVLDLMLDNLDNVRWFSK